jgi:hypothetical protein
MDLYMLMITGYVDSLDVSLTRPLALFDAREP